MPLHFLMCSERSGSNLITKIFNGHSKICGPTPKHIFNPVARNLFRYEPITNRENWQILLDDIYQLLSVSFSIWKKTFLRNELDTLAPVGDIKSLLQNIFFEEAHQFGKQYVFIKENQVYEFLPFLMIHFPESRFIYQVRDPRDMALSWKKSKVHSGGIVNGARQWKKDQQNTLKTFVELRKIGKGCLIKYEDLISDPENTIKRIVEYLGLQFEIEMLDYHNDDITQKNSIRLETWDNLSKPIMTDNKNKYKSQLGEYEIKLIEKICYFEMQYLGYNTEFKLPELKTISEEEIEEYHSQELISMRLDRSNGVKENMDAKKTFYQRLL